MKYLKLKNCIQNVMIYQSILRSEKRNRNIIIWSYVKQTFFLYIQMLSMCLENNNLSKCPHQLVSVSHSKPRFCQCLYFYGFFRRKNIISQLRLDIQKKVSFDMNTAAQLLDVHIQQFQRTLQCVDNLQMQIGLFIEIYLYSIPLLLKYQVWRVILSGQKDNS